MGTCDSKDLKILYHLDQNSRLPYSKLGDAISMSQEAVRYRVKRLLEQGIVNTLTTVVDVAKLGSALYKVFLKLHNVNEQIISDMIEYLRASSQIAWVARTDGSFDLTFAVRAADIHDVLLLSNTVDELVGKFDCFINRRVFCVNISGEYLRRAYLVNRKRRIAKTGYYTVRSKPQVVDKINVQILKKLARNSRLSAVQLAENLPISSDAVLGRIKQLEKQKIITQYLLVLNHHLMDQIHFKVFIFLNHATPEKLNEFLNHCKSYPNVIYIIKTLGEWDCELDIEVRNIKQYRELMMDLTSRFATIIKSYDALMISRIHKYNLFP